MREILLALSITPGIGWKTIHKLVVAGLDVHCLNMSSNQWLNEFSFLTEQQARKLSEWIQEDRLASYHNKLGKGNIEYITIVDDAYPSYLKEIAFAPWLLFLIGDRHIMHTPSLAVVGSRKTTKYGRLVTEQLIPRLVQKGWAITSGLAMGIDSIAHQATLQAQGKTIAVLGSGIDMIYPEQNKHTYHKLVKQGLIISEYPPGTPPHPGYFPQRNRIIAGLSHGVVVIEAAKQSGSLITAHFALEQGREVFAVPGSIYNSQSVGTNLLIQKHGAKLITNHDDILEELSHVQVATRENQNLSLPVQEGIHLDDSEKKILELLKTEKRHINELQTMTDIDFSELIKILLKLELKRQVKALPGSFYQYASLPS